MFIDSAGRRQKSRPASRLFWRTAWIIQAALWLFLIFLVADYRLYEIPATRNYYAAGLEQGFDSLAGIIAAMDVYWEETRRIRGSDIPERLHRLQGDSAFNVWLELDEMPSWNSGLGCLKFDRQGRLLWVRRYFISKPPLLASRQSGGAEFSVLKPRLDLRPSPAPARINAETNGDGGRR
ncbi:MAG: hypothetical protein LBQ63_00305 [Deltaproteobacteria bacterium]|jgi:hypothetical protein|nr:hypothetical protein [Deltaproteobacteria bacterium]